MKRAWILIAALVVVGAGALVLLQPDGQRQAQAAEATITVSSMICESCQETVQSAIRNLPGVQTVAVDLGAKRATVTYTPDAVSVPQIENAIVRAGYAANDKPADAEAYAALPMCCKIE